MKALLKIDRYICVFCLKLDEKPNDHLSFADFLTVVHEDWKPIDDDKQELRDAFDTLDPECKSKLMVDEFVNLLKNCDWPDEEIDLLLSQLSCADGYFLHDGNNHPISCSLHISIDLHRSPTSSLNASGGSKEKIQQSKEEEINNPFFFFFSNFLSLMFV